MMDLLKRSFKLYGLMIVASFMCFILVMSFNMMASAFLTKEIGYTMHGTKVEGEKLQELYEYHYDDGEDLLKEKYETEGYTLTKAPLRSKIDPKSGFIWDMVAQVFLIFMAGVFIYNNLWNLGNKDMKEVRHNLQKEDKLKGLKIGIITTIPSLCLLTACVLMGKLSFGKDVSVAMFGFLNPYLYNAIKWIAGGQGGVFSGLAVWQIVCYYALFIIVPIIALVSYILGYNDVIVSEKLIYKKK